MIWGVNYLLNEQHFKDHVIMLSVKKKNVTEVLAVSHFTTACI